MRDWKLEDLSDLCELICDSDYCQECDMNGHVEVTRYRIRHSRVVEFAAWTRSNAESVPPNRLSPCEISRSTGCATCSEVLLKKIQGHAHIIESVHICSCDRARELLI